MIKREGVRSRLSWPWRSVGALVLGVLLAKWTWVLFAPHATAMAVQPEHAPAEEAGRLFGTAVSGVPVAQAVALPNVSLVGVFAASAGKPGFAVLKLDGRQQVGVAVGESVVSGTRLAEVHPDHVVLERAGAQQRVDLEGLGGGTAPAGVMLAPK